MKMTHRIVRDGEGSAEAGDYKSGIDFSLPYLSIT